MAEQSYSNHIRFYTPHHFIFYPVMLVFIVIPLYFAWTDEINRLLWLFMAAAFLAIALLSFMMRQHYALTLQNRIVLMELRYRYFVVTGQRLEPLEERLTEGQLFALRFASDEELAELTQKAVNENFSPNKIKKAIKNWKADDRRV